MDSVPLQASLSTICGIMPDTRVPQRMRLAYVRGLRHLHSNKGDELKLVTHINKMIINRHKISEKQDGVEAL